MDNISTVKTLETCQHLLDNPHDFAFLQWLVRLFGNVPKQVSTCHIRSHQIVGVIIFETLEQFQNVLASRERDFLQNVKLLKLLMIFVKHSVNDFFGDLFYGHLHAWVSVFGHINYTKATFS